MPQLLEGSRWMRPLLLRRSATGSHQMNLQRRRVPMGSFFFWRFFWAAVHLLDALIRGLTSILQTMKWAKMACFTVVYVKLRYGTKDFMMENCLLVKLICWQGSPFSSSCLWKYRKKCLFFLVVYMLSVGLLDLNSRCWCFFIGVWFLARNPLSSGGKRWIILGNQVARLNLYLVSLGVLCSCLPWKKEETFLRFSLHLEIFYFPWLDLEAFLLTRCAEIKLWRLYNLEVFYSTGFHLEISRLFIYVEINYFKTCNLENFIYQDLILN